MEFSAEQIAGLIGGKTDGDPAVKVNRLSRIENGEPGSLTFLSNPKYAPFIYTTGASVIIVNADFAAEQKVSSTLIRVPDAYEAFVKLLEVYNEINNSKAGIEHPAFVSDTARIGKNVYIGAFAYIGEHVIIGNNVKIHPQVYIGDNVIIGDNTVLFQGVRVYAECSIGRNGILHSGSVIGADGFGFTPQKGNIYKKVAQIGNVIIEDDVEIGANTTVDRATLGSTIIRKGVKLDNLIQVGHNVEIGANTVIAAQTGIAGSTKIGKDCMIGGQVGIVGHIVIADKVKIAAQSGVGSSIEKEGEIVQGSPAFNIGDYKRTYVHFRNLPNLEKRIQELEAALLELKQLAS